jgi:hypothetical protein
VRNISPSRPYTPQKTLLRYCSNSFPHLGTMEPPIRRLSCIHSKINPLYEYCSWQENLIFIPHRSGGVPNVGFFISIYQQLEKRETSHEFCSTQLYSIFNTCLVHRTKKTFAIIVAHT